MCDPMPSALVVGGIPFAIASDHRTGVRCMSMLDRVDLTPEERAAHVLLALYGEHVPQDVAAAVERAMWFLGANALPSRRRASGPRPLDWDIDSPLIAADFQREYAIDLTDPATSMHWWRFMALFRGLSDGSRTMQEIGARTAEADADDGPAERSRIKKLRRDHALPPRTMEEADAAEAEWEG